MKHIFSLALIGGIMIQNEVKSFPGQNPSQNSTPQIVVMEQRVDRSLLAQLQSILRSFRDRVAHVTELDLSAQQQLANNVYNFRRELVSHQDRVDIGTEVLQMIQQVDGFLACIRSTTEHSLTVHRRLLCQDFNYMTFGDYL